jgi:Helicase associated domain
MAASGSATYRTACGATSLSSHVPTYNPRCCLFYTAVDLRTKRFKINRLGQKRLSDLRSSIFAEIVNEIGTGWDEWFGRLVRYKEREGLCLVPAIYKTEEGFGLGGWVRKQRMDNAKNSLSASRKERLDAIGLVWKVGSEFFERKPWEENFALLQKFKHREGHCEVHHDHLEGTFSLGRRVRRQRENRATISEERRRLLDSVGFVWDRHSKAWEEGFAALKAFKAREGHLNITPRHKEGTFWLCQWVRDQRYTRHIQPDERPEKIG